MEDNLVVRSRRGAIVAWLAITISIFGVLAVHRVAANPRTPVVSRR